MIDPAPQGAPRSHVQVLAEIAALSGREGDLGETVESALALLRAACGLAGAGVLRRDGNRFVALAATGGRPPGTGDDVAKVVEAALRAGPGRRGVARQARRAAAGTGGARQEGGAVAAFEISSDAEPHWGILWATAPDSSIDGLEAELLRAVAVQLGLAVSHSRLLDALAREVRTSAAIRAMAADTSSKLNLGTILSGLVDQAVGHFRADRAAVYTRRPDGALVAEIAQNLSPEYVAAVRSLPSPSIAGDAMEARRAVFAVDFATDPRSDAIRDLVVREGFDTVCAAPLVDSEGVLGLLVMYHDQHHEWSRDELDTLELLATQASVAIRTAQRFAQMATWTAQLQSIQDLGSRLSRLTSVPEIGAAIAAELRQIIDYHNVRVYRLVGEVLLPVASHGSWSMTRPFPQPASASSKPL